MLHIEILRRNVTPSSKGSHFFGHVRPCWMVIWWNQRDFLPPLDLADKSGMRLQDIGPVKLMKQSAWGQVWMKAVHMGRTYQKIIFLLMLCFFHRPVDTGRGVDPLGRKSKGSVHVTLSPHPIGQASNQIGISETNFANSNHCVPFCYRYERSTRMSCVRSEFIGHSEAEWMPIEWLQLESKHKHYRP